MKTIVDREELINALKTYNRKPEEAIEFLEYYDFEVSK